MSLSLSSLGIGLLLIVLVILSLYSTWYSAREWAKSYLLNRHGQTTQAKITSTRSNFNRVATYFVTYRFSRKTSKARKVFSEKEQAVSWRHIKRLKMGDAVEVIYLPRNPKISQLIGSHLDNTDRDSGSIFAVVVALFFPFFPTIIGVWITIFLLEWFYQKTIRG